MTKQIEAHIELGLKGRFIVHKGKCDADGNPIESTREKVAEFDNRILNQGMDSLGGPPSSSTEQWFYWCEVGTGTTAPADTDTALATFLARTATVQDTVGIRDIVGSPNYFGMRKTWRFGAGAAAGNITEFAIARGTATPTVQRFCRALVKDALGNPTSITVLADEYLDVTYEFRVLIPETDVSGTITLDGVLRNWTIRPTEVDRQANSADQGWPGSSSFYTHGPKSGLVTSSFSNMSFLSNDSLVDRTLIPTSMSDGQIAPGGRTDAAYVNGSYQRDMTLFAGLTVGNALPIRTICFQTYLGSYQCEFDPPLAKTSEMTLTLTFRMSWVRA